MFGSRLLDTQLDIATAFVVIYVRNKRKLGSGRTVSAPAWHGPITWVHISGELHDSPVASALNLWTLLAVPRYRDCDSIAENTKSSSSVFTWRRPQYRSINALFFIRFASCRSLPSNGTHLSWHSAQCNVLSELIYLCRSCYCKVLLAGSTILLYRLPSRYIPFIGAIYIEPDHLMYISCVSKLQES